MCNLKLRLLTTPTDNLRLEYHFEKKRNISNKLSPITGKSCEVWDKEYFAWNLQDFFFKLKMFITKHYVHLSLPILFLILNPI